MKTDLRALKEELTRLTDLDYLKKEFARVAAEVKKLEVHLQPIHLTPATRRKLEKLEKRFRKLLNSIQTLQKRVDTNLDRFIRMVREKRAARPRSTGKSATTSMRSSKTKSKMAAAPSDAPVATTLKKAPKNKTESANADRKPRKKESPRAASKTGNKTAKKG